MNEERFAKKICAALNGGLKELDSALVGRIEQARRRALARHRVLEPAGDLVGAGRGGRLEGGSPFPSRWWWSAGALVLVLASVAFWSHRQDMLEPAEVDAALLSGDLPVRAYIDPQFHAWLKRSEQ